MSYLYFSNLFLFLFSFFHLVGTTGQTVVVTCDTGYKGGTDSYYTHHEKSCGAGNNIQLYHSKTIQECKKLCDDYGSACKGIEFGVDYGSNSYNPGDCQLNSISNLPAILVTISCYLYWKV